jgi:hypothetical protein
MSKHVYPYKTIANLKWAYENAYITVKEMRAVNLDWARVIEFDAARLDGHIDETEAEWAELENPPVYTTGTMVCISYNFENTASYYGYPVKGTMGLGMVLKGNEDKSSEILVLWHVEPRPPREITEAAEEWGRASSDRSTRRKASRIPAYLAKLKNRSSKSNFQHTESVLRYDSKARASGCHISKWAPVPHVVF